jgi:hypothetical protein
MKTEMLIKVRRLFNVDYVPQSTNRHNQRQYIKSIRQLGNRWLIHQDNQINKFTDNEKQFCK